MKEIDDDAFESAAMFEESPAMFDDENTSVGDTDVLVSSDDGEDSVSAFELDRDAEFRHDEFVEIDWSRMNGDETVGCNHDYGMA